MRVSLTHPLLCFAFETGGGRVYYSTPGGITEEASTGAGAATGSMSVQPVVLGEDDLTARRTPSWAAALGAAVDIHHLRRAGHGAEAIATMGYRHGDRDSRQTLKSDRVDSHTQTGTPIQKTTRQRVTYLFALLNIVLIWPLWLKVITLRYKIVPERVGIYNSSIGVRVNAPGIWTTGEADDCQLCGDGNIFYDVSVNVTNYNSPKFTKSASYVQLLASFETAEEPEDWYVVSTSPVLDGLKDRGKRSEQQVNVCRTDPSSSSSSASVPAPAPTSAGEGGLCCLGSPGAVYLVACILPDYPEENLWDKVPFKLKTKFDSRCVALDGVCGSACGFDTRQPKYCTYDGDEPWRGRLDVSHLISGFDQKGGPEVYTVPFSDESSAVQNIMHAVFMMFMTITVVSMWISFLPGVGADDDPPNPSLENLQEYMDSAMIATSKPLVLVAFSISASEPRMMILRNMVGKIMAWCNNRRIFLDKTEPAWPSFDERDKEYQKSPKDKILFIDVFQDEGHRPGAYALWDSFTDLINGSDITFIEKLADDMRDMSAVDRRLKSNRTSREQYVEKVWTTENCTKKIKSALKERFGDEEMGSESKNLDESKKKSELYRGGLDGAFIRRLDEKDLRELLKSPEILESEEEDNESFVRQVILEAIKDIRKDINAFDELKYAARRENEVLNDKIKKQARECGCLDETINIFELAWASFDLLNKLGHYSYWSHEGAGEDSLDPLFNYDYVEDNSAVDKREEFASYSFKDIMLGNHLSKDLRSINEAVSAENKLSEALCDQVAKSAGLDKLFVSTDVDLRRMVSSKSDYGDASGGGETSDERLGRRGEGSDGSDDGEEDAFVKLKKWIEVASRVVEDMAEEANAQKMRTDFTGHVKKWAKLSQKQDPFNKNVLENTFGEKFKEVIGWWEKVRTFGFWTSADFEVTKDIKFSFYRTEAEEQCSLGCIYSARAKPKEFSVEPYQGIKEGVIVRLKHQYEDRNEEEERNLSEDQIMELDCHYPGATPRQYARSCTARVQKVNGSEVHLINCSSKMKYELQKHQKSSKNYTSSTTSGREVVPAATPINFGQSSLSTDTAVIYDTKEWDDGTLEKVIEEFRKEFKRGFRFEDKSRGVRLLRELITFIQCAKEDERLEDLLIMEKKNPVKRTGFESHEDYIHCKENGEEGHYKNQEVFENFICSLERDAYKKELEWKRMKFTSKEEWRKFKYIGGGEEVSGEYHAYREFCSSSGSGMPEWFYHLKSSKVLRLKVLLEREARKAKANQPGGRSTSLSSVDENREMRGGSAEEKEEKAIKYRPISEFQRFHRWCEERGMTSDRSRAQAWHLHTAVKEKSVPKAKAPPRKSEFICKIDCLAPLRPSRGKAGGMNSALDVLEEYLLRKNMDAQGKLFPKGGSEAISKKNKKEKTGTMLFSVFDCRHMAQQGFWEAAVPYFFKYRDGPNRGAGAGDEEDEMILEINEEACFVQMPQTFAELELDEDFFDMRNEYGFRVSNTVRSGVGAVTSCGTNACWNIDLNNVLTRRVPKKASDERPAPALEAQASNKSAEASVGLEKTEQVRGAEISTGGDATNPTKARAQPIAASKKRDTVKYEDLLRRIDRWSKPLGKGDMEVVEKDDSKTVKFEDVRKKANRIVKILAGDDEGEIARVRLPKCQRNKLKLTLKDGRSVLVDEADVQLLRIALDEKNRGRKNTFVKTSKEYNPTFEKGEKVHAFISGQLRSGRVREEDAPGKYKISFSKDPQSKKTRISRQSSLWSRLANQNKPESDEIESVSAKNLLSVTQLEEKRPFLINEEKAVVEAAQDEIESIYGRRIVKYRFNTDTMIEDTASSHAAVLEGRKSIYHFERLVIGARKGAADYLAAIYRWSKGAVQLMCTSYLECPDFGNENGLAKCCAKYNIPASCCCWRQCCGRPKKVRMKSEAIDLPGAKWCEKTFNCFPKYCNGCCFKNFCAKGSCLQKLYFEFFWPIFEAWWPWIFLAVFVFPIIAAIGVLQSIDLNEDQPTDAFGYKFCNGSHKCTEDNKYKDDFWIMSLVFYWPYLAYIFWMCIVATAAFKHRRIATYVILIENTTYFCNSSSAFFWSFLPFYMATTGTIPFSYDPAFLTLGGFWLELWTWVLLSIIKEWAPNDGGKFKKPPEKALIRAQQMYFLTAPLHIYAMITGLPSGAGVKFFGIDASFWNSFENTTSLTIVNVWAIILTATMLVSMLAALINVIIMGYRVELLIGFCTSFLIFQIIYEPVAAIFFHKQMTAYKKNQRFSRFTLQRCAESIFGKGAQAAPKHFFVLFWFILFILATLSDRNGVLWQRWI